MSDETGIEWTDHTFNPWWGCERVSPACAHCYADTFARRTGAHLWGAEAPRRPASESYWQKPVKWNQAAQEAGGIKLVFCASMADVFENRRDLDQPRERLWGVIEQTPWLHWQLLTKRPEEVMALAPWGDLWPANVWIGTSIENSRFTFRADILREIPAAVHFLSCEPLLGSLFRSGGKRRPLDLTHIEWVITGGESGPGFRPLDLWWVREVRDACVEQGIAYFHKQNGGLRPKSGGKAIDGREWCEKPLLAAGGAV